MLSDDVAEKGYALLCMAMPQTDCKIMTVTEVGMVQQRCGAVKPLLPVAVVALRSCYWSYAAMPACSRTWNCRLVL
jgi:hypothetical protein